MFEECKYEYNYCADCGKESSADPLIEEYGICESCMPFICEICYEEYDYEGYQICGKCYDDLTPANHLRITKG